MFSCHFCNCQLWFRWHEASGNLFGNHTGVENKNCASSKRHNPSRDNRFFSRNPYRGKRLRRSMNNPRLLVVGCVGNTQ